MRPVKKKDLVVLMHTQNECYVKVVKVDHKNTKHEKLQLSLKEGLWTTGNSPIWFRIGEISFLHRKGSLVILGVYDATNIKHLNSMVATARATGAPIREV